MRFQTLWKFLRVDSLNSIPVPAQASFLCADSSALAERSSSVPCLKPRTSLPFLKWRSMCCCVPRPTLMSSIAKTPTCCRTLRWIRRTPSGNGKPFAPLSSKPDARLKPSLPLRDSKTWSSPPTRSLWVFTNASASSSCPAAWCTLHGGARCLSMWNGIASAVSRSSNSISAPTIWKAMATSSGTRTGLASMLATVFVRPRPASRNFAKPCPNWESRLSRFV